jgi:hypothetical protein
VAAAIGATLAGLIGVGIAVAVLVHHFERREHAGDAAMGLAGDFQHGVEEKTSVQESWLDYDRGVRAHLGGYGWVDRRSGIVRIPIDRAMDLVAGAPSTPLGRPVDPPNQP